MISLPKIKAIEIIPMHTLEIKPISPTHLPWIRQFLTECWGSAQIISRGRVHHTDQLPGFVAQQGDQPVGLITYHIEGQACEITSLDSLIEGIGVGSALIDAVKSAAIEANGFNLWLITTNDNTPAICFYQKRGFHLVAVHCEAIQRSRQLKPGIPMTGIDNIPIRDEIEFEMLL